MNTPMKVEPKWLKAAAARLPSSVKLIDALYRAIKQPDIDIDHVIRLMSMDIAVTTRMLRMANSASYSRGDTATSIDQALSWLGTFQAYRVACLTVSAQLCEEHLTVYRISAEKLLANSIAMAVGMEVLAKKTDLDPKTAYTIGLLHNLGRIVLQRVSKELKIPKGAGDLPDIHAVMQWERDTFGYTYTEIGAFVFNFWGMNPIFSKVIGQQRDLDQITDSEVRRWSALLHLTATLVATTDYGLGVANDAWPISETTFEHAGVDNVDLFQLSEVVSVATKELCEQSGLVLTPLNVTNTASVG